MDLRGTLPLFFHFIYLSCRQYPGEVFYHYQWWWIYLQWYLFLSLISLWLRKQILRTFFCKIECWAEVFFYAITEYSNLVREKIKFLFRACYSRFDCYRWLLSLIRKSEKIDENENIIHRIRSFSLITLHSLSWNMFFILAYGKFRLSAEVWLKDTVLKQKITPW